MSDSNETALYEQLAQLREITRIYGALHEAQVLQLKHWPRVLYGVKAESKAIVNFKSKTVEFSIKTDRKDILANADATLKEWTKTLIGDDWVVEIDVKYRRIRRQAAAKPDAEGTAESGSAPKQQGPAVEPDGSGSVV